jgi:hypothetical protein
MEDGRWRNPSPLNIQRANYRSGQEGMWLPHLDERKASVF